MQFFTKFDNRLVLGRQSFWLKKSETSNNPVTMNGSNQLITDWALLLLLKVTCTCTCTTTIRINSQFCNCCS